MHFKGFEICCPVCKGNLCEQTKDKEQLICEHCNKTYPVILGIPDLRVFPDPYIDFEADREKGRHVAEQFDEHDFPGLIDYYYGITDVVPPKHAKMYKRGLMAGEARANAFLNSFNNHLNSGVEQESLLEIGCGTSPLLVVASKRFNRLIGIDIAFRWLIIGKKRLQEANLDIPLICACAEALPFRDKAFSQIVGESTIEHSKKQFKILNECHRILVPGGYLFLSTPNRFSLGPDPHTGLIAGGYFPASIIAKYVSRMGGIPPHRKLLSRYSLSKLLKKAGFSFVQFFLPDFPDEQRKHFPSIMNKLVNVYHFLKKVPLANSFLFLFGPFIYAICQKGDDR